jgi:hypothetical protein
MALSKSERENVAMAGGTAVVGSTLGWTASTIPAAATALSATKAGAIIAAVGGPVGIVIGGGLLCVAGISAYRNRNKK